MWAAFTDDDDGCDDGNANDNVLMRRRITEVVTRTKMTMTTMTKPGMGQCVNVAPGSINVTGNSIGEGRKVEAKQPIVYVPCWQQSYDGVQCWQR